MDNYLRIKAFKRITTEINLMDFGKVNYIIGPNNSGKTSILTAIARLFDPNQARHFMSEGGLIELSIRDQTFSIYKDEPPGKSRNYTEHAMDIVVSLPMENIFDVGLSNLWTAEFGDADKNQERFNFLNETAKMLEQGAIEPQMKVVSPFNSSSDNVTDFRQNGVNVNLDALSSGLKSFNSLRFKIEWTLTTLQGNGDATKSIIFLVDEPETNLHPSLQKKVPDYINEIITQQPIEIQNKIFFFVSTHSPFLVSSSRKYDCQKVYLVKDGSLIDLDNKVISESKGYLAKDTVSVVAKMLGSDIESLGYPQNFCILEESSLQTILDHSREKGFLKDIVFFSAGGWATIPTYKETISHIERHVKLLHVSPLYGDSYLVILDNSGKFAPGEKKRIDKIKNGLGDRYYELSLSSLEDYYSNLNAQLAQQCQADIKRAKNNSEIAKIKGLYATEIIKLVNSREDFSKLFWNCDKNCGELDFLLQ